ncbi:MAG: radical SAM protein [Candidatus Krumholzibacteria bacterium]|nr:radical SAM protein [Candidatus Krumholzibacteria bacterium]
MQTESAPDRFLFPSKDFEPAYLALYRSGDLLERTKKAVESLAVCRVCPRDCGVDRLENKTATCKTGRYALVNSHFPHLGEEDPLRGWRGSGTIFFTQCNLRCVFCQNFDISQISSGVETRPDRLAEMMLELQFMGCHNINFVTPEHVAPQVIEAIAEAIPRGLSIPIVYNTSAYDSVRSLELLDGLVDIYMPDFKLWRQATSLRLVKAKDYAPKAREAILEMHRQVGPLKFGPDGTARRGVLVRHLVMPGLLDESREIFRWLSEKVSPDTYINIMAQYRPEYRVGTRSPGPHGQLRYEEIDRRPGRDELEEAYQLARRAGLWRFDERRL